MEDIQTPVAGSDTAIQGAAVDGTYRLVDAPTQFRLVTSRAVNCWDFTSRVEVKDPTLPARFYIIHSRFETPHVLVHGESAEFTPGVGWVKNEMWKTKRRESWAEALRVGYCWPRRREKRA